MTIMVHNNFDGMMYFFYFSAFQTYNRVIIIGDQKMHFDWWVYTGGSMCFIVSHEIQFQSTISEISSDLSERATIHAHRSQTPDSEM